MSRYDLRFRCARAGDVEVKVVRGENVVWATARRQGCQTHNGRAERISERIQSLDQRRSTTRAEPFNHLSARHRSFVDWSVKDAKMLMVVTKTKGT